MVLDADVDAISAKHLPNRKWSLNSYPDVQDINMIGLMPQEICYILTLEQVRNVWITPPECYRDHELDPWMYQYKDNLALPGLVKIQKHIETHRAILGVPSLNIRDNYHWVYVDRGTVYDPARLDRKRYGKKAALEIGEAILIW